MARVGDGLCEEQRENELRKGQVWEKLAVTLGRTVQSRGRAGGGSPRAGSSLGARRWPCPGAGDGRDSPWHCPKCFTVMSCPCRHAMVCSWHWSP